MEPSAKELRHARMVLDAVLNRRTARVVALLARVKGFEEPEAEVAGDSEAATRE